MPCLVTAMSVFKTEPTYTIGLLALIALLNAFLAITCLRLRDVIESYIEKASRFSPDFGMKGGRPTTPMLPWVGAFSVSIGYAFMMGTISLAAAIAPLFVVTRPAGGVTFGWAIAYLFPFCWTFVSGLVYVWYSRGRSIGYLTDRTIKYYEANWREYADRTLAIDMADIRNEFLRRLPSGGSVLDVGAGAGRDCRAFVAAGFKTTALEPTPAFAKLLRSIPTLEVRQASVEDIEDAGAFDGIWACASLLHLDEVGLNVAMDRLNRALKPGGRLYVSIRDGARVERAKDGRLFHDLTLERLRRMVLDRGLTDERSWQSEPRMTGTNQAYWNNIIARKPT